MDEEFLLRCEGYYGKGYKDWHILGAIVNVMSNKRLQQVGNKLRTKEELEMWQNISDQLAGLVYPTEEFVAAEMDIMFTAHAISCLKRYGFEYRGAGLVPESIMNFLRHRMRHFDLDIPHPPMFGRPPNDWPRALDTK